MLSSPLLCYACAGLVEGLPSRGRHLGGGARDPRGLILTSTTPASRRRNSCNWQRGRRRRGRERRETKMGKKGKGDRNRSRRDMGTMDPMEILAHPPSRLSSIRWEGDRPTDRDRQSVVRRRGCQAQTSFLLRSSSAVKDGWTDGRTVCGLAHSHSSNYLPSICHKMRPEDENDEDDEDDGRTDFSAAPISSLEPSSLL